MPFSFKGLYFCMLVVVPQLLTRDLPRDTTTGLQLERCGHCDSAVICRALVMVAVVLPRQREVWALGEDQSFLQPQLMMLPWHPVPKKAL